jgi:Leucine-rich repeat (LRR) protein
MLRIDTDYNNNNNPWSKLTELNFQELTSYLPNDDEMIFSFDPRLFQVLPNLEKLELGFYLYYLKDKNPFQNARNLTHLSIGANDFGDLLHDSFKGLANLRVLSLSARQIDFRAFTCLEKLEELTLRTVLETINSTVFADLKKLKVLNLQNCSIKSIEPSAFDHLKDLEMLNLSNNKLEQIKLANAAPRQIIADDNADLTSVELNSSCVSKISEISLSFSRLIELGHNIHTLLFKQTMLASSLPMDGLTNLKIKPIETMSFYHFTSLNELSLVLTNFQDLKQGQLSCLSNLKTLKLSIAYSGI